MFKSSSLLILSYESISDVKIGQHRVMLAYLSDVHFTGRFKSLLMEAFGPPILCSFTRNGTNLACIGRESEDSCGRRWGVVSTRTRHGGPAGSGSRGR